jgi:hypothetical protein
MGTTSPERSSPPPSLAVTHPYQIFLDEAIAGLLLGLAIAPAAPFLASRLRLRITDSLPFPLLWLALLLLVGRVSVAELEILPGAVIDPLLFLTSVLLYAPAAWFACLAFSRSEAMAQQRFVRRAWSIRSSRLHFGRLLVAEDPGGSTQEV